MTQHSHGYDVSVGYSYGFSREMAPDWIDFCARLAGHTPATRERETPFRFLELGCGQGAGLCLVAAANPQGEFVGIDVQPEHVAHARCLAAAGGLANARFEQGDFVALAADWPAEFGTFDYIALHGVYTWVSAPVRAAIVACLGHAARTGALVYNGYNTQPGWLGSMPFQHIAQSLKMATGEPAVDTLRQAVGLFDHLHEAGCDTFRFLPGLKANIDTIKTRKPEYLIHEYLHEGWQPLWHSHVARAFAGAGIEYLGPATIAEAVLPMALPEPLRDAVLAQPGSRMQQDVLDFVINQSFRRDVSCRAPYAPREPEIAAIGTARIHLIAPPAPGADVVITPAFGEVRLQPQAYSAIVDALGSGPRTIRELAAGQAFENVLQIVIMLLQAGVLGLGEGRSAESCERFNAALARGACEGLSYGHLAAGAMGSAIRVETLDLLLLDAWLSSGRSGSASALAAAVAERMAGVGGGFEREGKPLPDAEVQPYLEQLVTQFLDTSLPAWRKLGAIA